MKRPGDIFIYTNYNIIQFVQFLSVLSVFSYFMDQVKSIFKISFYS